MSEAQPYEELWLEGPRSTNFYTRVYSPLSVPARAVLVYVHGYIDQISGSYYTEDHATMAQHGIAVFTWDQRGFGKTALGEARSPGSKYGYTGNGEDRMRDVEWAVKEASSRFKGLPVYLMGFSMGGGIVLDFASRSEAPPSKELQTLVRGVIACSPLIGLVNGPPAVLRILLTWLSKLLPNLQWPTAIMANDLSHDPKIPELVANDPLLQPHGSLQGLADMLGRGARLLSSDYKKWPKDLPVLFLHGTADPVTLFKATQEFHDELHASHKSIITYPNMMHALNTEPEAKEEYRQDIISWVLERSPAT